MIKFWRKQNMIILMNLSINIKILKKITLNYIKLISIYKMILKQKKLN